jgi:hypothetical protein
LWEGSAGAKRRLPSSKSGTEAPPAFAAVTFWQSVEASDDPKEYRAYLEQFPEGAFVALAEARLDGSGGTPSSGDHTIELEFWNSKDTEARANFEAYLDKYPDGEFRSLAEIRLGDLPETVGSDRSWKPLDRRLLHR